MNSRQDQNIRGGRSRTALDNPRVAESDQEGRPTSRRAAREAERRAAEALAAGQPHPSGVVDFASRDFSADLTADQGFQDQDTSDIWAALGRRADTPPAPTQPPATDLQQFRSGVPQTPAVQRPTPNPPSAVSDELLDRVRGAVLGRDRDGHAPHPASPPATPERTALTRRELRARQLADAREDELPAEWFAQGAAQPAAPAQPQERGRYDAQAFVDYDEAYYDAPYQPEPTIAIPALCPTELEPQSSITGPMNLPHFFAEPAGTDSLTFSSPVPTTPAEPRAEYADVDPAFVEPRSPWGDPGGRGAAPTPAPMSFLPPTEAEDEYEYPAAPGYPGAAGYPAATEQPAMFNGPQLGPPSEVTDLAGFEALIRQARNTPAAPQRAEAPAAKPSLPWADDEDLQDGFTGLLSRSVQGSHGSPNALILPNDPQPDLTQAVNRTGEIFITGSMNLSRTLSTTGATANTYDSLDIDRIFDASQHEAAGVAPVLATSAISGAGSRSLVIGRRARGNILPTVLAVVAGVMAVGVVTLLVGSWLLKLF